MLRPELSPRQNHIFLFLQVSESSLDVNGNRELAEAVMWFSRNISARPSSSDQLLEECGERV